jgi:hypothetical protein
LGGCTSAAVARRVRGRLDDVGQAAREIARASLDALIGNEPDRARDHPDQTAPRLVLWNPVARRRRGPVVIADLTWFRRDVLVGPPGGRRPRLGDGARAVALAGPDGPLVTQPLGRASGHERLDAPRHYPDQDEVDVVRVAFRAPALAGFGLSAVEPLERPRMLPEPGARAGARSLDNGLLALTVARDGTVTLADRRSGLLYPSLLGLESSGDVGDTYTYAPRPRDRVARMKAAGPVRVLAAGPLVSALEVRGTLPVATGHVGVRWILTLHAESPVLRCTLEADNRATDHRLRLRVPTGVPGIAAVAGGPFGAVTRTAVSADGGRYTRETPVATAPAQRFVAVAGSSRGLAVLAPGFFEYELAADGDVRVTLLRAVGQLSRGDLSTRPGHAGWPTATPEAQCLGLDRLQLAIAPVDARDLHAGSALPELWEDVFLPPRAVWLRQATPLRLPELELQLEGAGLVLSSVKPAEEGEAIVLRCYNARGEPVDGRWRFSRRAARAVLIRADERGGSELPLGADGRAVSFRAGPHAMITIALHPAPPA